MPRKKTEKVPEKVPVFQDLLDVSLDDIVSDSLQPLTNEEVLKVLENRERPINDIVASFKNYIIKNIEVLDSIKPRATMDQINELRRTEDPDLTKCVVGYNLRIHKLN